VARHFTDSALDAVAVRARLLLATVLEDLLGDGALAQRVHVRSAHAAQVFHPLPLIQQYARAVLADAVQHLDDVFQVADVECGQRQLDVAKVAVALVKALTTGSTCPSLARYAHVDVHGPIGRESAGVVCGGLEVIDIAVGYFEDGLVHDILVGAAEYQHASVLERSCHGGALLDAESNMLDARGDAVHDLLLGRGARSLHGGGGGGVHGGY